MSICCQLHSSPVVRWKGAVVPASRKYKQHGPLTKGETDKQVTCIIDAAQVGRGAMALLLWLDWVT
jgi:hypothetical protein